MTERAETIALSLVSHTNVGKTTLARTLLGRDIGEVRDEAHVTQAAERHLLVASDDGDRLELWDTPGFGDSVRLARRLAQQGNPIGWFLAEVWDRFRDRAWWSAQRAMRHVIADTDVVLYLVNAAESPDDASYLDAEMTVLRLLGKPVVVLLNQLGPPQPAAVEAAQREAWQRRVGRPVLALDAFARCWVQEGALLDAVGQALPPARLEAFARLRAAWRERQHAVFAAAVDELARRIARAAVDRQALPPEPWRLKLRALGQAVGRTLGLAADATDGPQQQAMALLAQRLSEDLRASTDRLIALHGLDGRASETVLARVAEQVSTRAPLDEGRAALWGGALTGALAGLKADVLSGGLTLGGGLIAGGLLGALGAAGLARGFNLVRGVDSTQLAWSEPALDGFVETALLGYLAVAHYGRGRGEWQAGESPAFWQPLAAEVVAAHRDALHRAWQGRDTMPEAALRAALAPPLQAMTDELLARLYPKTAGRAST